MGFKSYLTPLIMFPKVSQYQSCRIPFLSWPETFAPLNLKIITSCSTLLPVLWCNPNKFYVSANTNSCSNYAYPTLVLNGVLWLNAGVSFLCVKLFKHVSSWIWWTTNQNSCVKRAIVHFRCSITSILELK